MTLPIFTGNYQIILLAILWTLIISVWTCLRFPPERSLPSTFAAGRFCYLSAGAWEDFRSDTDTFPKEFIGRNYRGWPGERWLDVRNYESFSPAILARLGLAVRKGCDGIEPDNIQGYQEDTGFSITAADQLAYNRWLSEEAQARGR